jgi:triacylglycerol lipase
MSPRLPRRRWLALAAGSACTLATGLGTSRPALAQADSLPPAQTLKVFGVQIRYHELGQRGEKPTLVLLHGLGSSARGDWGQVMAALARTHHVLAPDQLGFGESDKPAITYGIQTWVDFLGEFLREKQVAAGFTLMGESLGGWIAAQYTLQALQGEAVGPSFVLPKPARLVLCNSAGFRQTQEGLNRPPAGSGSGVSLAGQKDILQRVFHAPSFSTEAAIRGGMAWSLAKGDATTVASVQSNPGLAREVLDGKLAGITVPTLVVWGQYDRLIPLALGERFAREIPGARLVVVPDTGHAPMIETPQAFLAAVQPFLQP